MIGKQFFLYHNNAVYYFNKTIGALLDVTEVKEKFKKRTEKKIASPHALTNYNAVLQPYQLKQTSFSKKAKLTTHPKFAKFLVKTYTYLCLKSFLFVRLLSVFRFPLFDNATDALVFYRKTIPQKQEDLCMPRSLFAAATSKKFKEKGTLFIGICLPTKAMHAWIIEDTCQPDLWDGIWINFQPVVIFYQK